MDKLKISVIIPAYNVEKYIGQAVESILTQTYKVFEIIVIDDGSTDDTVKILQQYADDNKIRLISTINNGQGYARNIGLLLAKGEYIYYFDADDLLNEHALEFLAEKISSNDFPDTVFFSGSTFIEPGFITDFNPNYDRYFKAEGITGFEALVKFDNSGRILASPCLYISRRDYWINHSLLFKNIIREDEEVILPLILNSNNVCVYTDKLFKRRVRPGSTMSNLVSEEHINGFYQTAITTAYIYQNSNSLPSRVKKVIKKRGERFLSGYITTCVAARVKPKLYRVVKLGIKLRSFRAIIIPLLKYLSRRVKNAIY